MHTITMKKSHFWLVAVDMQGLYLNLCCSLNVTQDLIEPNFDAQWLGI
jgi:hypothetical protein